MAHEQKICNNCRYYKSGRVNNADTNICIRAMGQYCGQQTEPWFTCEYWAMVKPICSGLFPPRNGIMRF